MGPDQARSAFAVTMALTATIGKIAETYPQPEKKWSYMPWLMNLYEETY